MIRKSYTGAGILFIAQVDGEVSGDEKGDHVLLGCRKRSGVWSIPGGGSSYADTDPWDTALRETIEEFGEIPTPYARVSSMRFPFGVLGFDWTTFVLRLAKIPDPSLFPNSQAKDFRHEFRDAQWFPIQALPPKTHILLRPVIARMRILGW